MLRSKIEAVTGPLNNQEFKAVCNMVDKDIKANQINFQVRTTLNYILQIAIISANIYRNR